MKASPKDVLENFEKAIPLNEHIVQIEPSIKMAYRYGRDRGAKVGLLHLGPGCHLRFGENAHRLVSGAIILFENCNEGSEAYVYANSLAARGHLDAVSEAKGWPGLGVAVYIGGK